MTLFTRIQRTACPASAHGPQRLCRRPVFFTMMTRLLPLSLTLALFATASPLFARDAVSLMIYGVSIGEKKAVVVKFHEKDGKPILEVVQSEPLGAQAGAITYHSDHNLLYIATQEGRGFVYTVNDDGRMEKVRETPFKSGYCFLSLDPQRALSARGVVRIRQSRCLPSGRQRPPREAGGLAQREENQGAFGRRQL